MTDFVKTCRQGCIATITLNRPDAYNALNDDMRAQLAQAISEIEQDPILRVVVLAGTGRGFCAGADLKMPSGKTSGAVLEEEFHPCLAPIWNSEKIYIAAVHGHAAGIGAALVLACDLVVMEVDAQLTLAFSAIGLVPDGGLCWHLTRALGPRRALEAIVEGHSLGASFCMANGLVNKVVDRETALATASSWASKLAKSAPHATAAAKRLVAQAMTSDLQSVFDAEADVQTQLALTNDHKRGVAAFLARGTPFFYGD
ncbi:MAG: enoyl-CoA hydratase/isomerase family protein [Yoonia sp.]|nr:enoyl-CoA hydratase/isomerase family protein [Yoonia sp.]